MRTIITILTFVLYSIDMYCQTDTSFYTNGNTLIKITLLTDSTNDFGKIEIRSSKNKTVQVLDSIEQSITGKQLNITIEDYNFDGFKDFSYCHIDDGTGTYFIYQIFIYNPKTNQFAKLEW